MIFWTSAFLLGLLGSVHCAVMCGPIVVTLFGHSKRSGKQLLAHGVYQLGRIGTYMLLGFFFGLFGRGLELSGMQLTLSLMIGIGILVFYFLPRHLDRLKWPGQWIVKLTAYLRRLVKPFIQSHALPSRFAMGAINGFLPCGLVYVAALGGLASNSPMHGVIYMFFFGLGTLPMVVGITYTSQNLIGRVRMGFNRVLPLLVVSIALLFVLRGLNLGIKYISPQIKTDSSSQEMTICPAGRR